MAIASWWCLIKTEQLNSLWACNFHHKQQFIWMACTPFCPGVGFLFSRILPTRKLQTINFEWDLNGKFSSNIFFLHVHIFLFVSFLFSIWMCWAKFCRNLYVNCFSMFDIVCHSNERCKKYYSETFDLNALNNKWAVECGSKDWP